MPKSLSKTPAPKKDRIYGSDKNKVGSASSKGSAKGIELSESILCTLSQKAKDYNESHPKNKVSVATLKAVMRRGMGAYSTSHRPTITGGAPNSRQAWGFARVNKFLKKKAGQQVKAAYVQDDDLMEKGGFIAPNGKTSNLTPEQYKLVRTPEFKSWFGDWENDPENASKVVDENGEPLVVYHGGINSINFFNSELNYFSPHRYISEDFANYKYGEKGKVFEVFLNIKNPKNFDAIYSDLLEIEAKKGFDGFIAKAVVLNDGSNEGKQFVAFEPNQIKLADGTNKSFDMNNPDIRYADGGSVGQEITCVNCGWHWNTSDSDESDKYICHKCGFDNRTFYDPEPIGEFNKYQIYKSIKPIRQANEIIERINFIESQNKMAQGGVTEFYKQYQDWYKNALSDNMTIMVSIPNAFSKMSSEDNHVILEVFEKRDESVDGKEKLKELLELADKNGIDVYLEPIPRHNKIKDEAKKEKITREYLISYYEKFGFELLPNGFMVRKHKNNKMEKGGYYKAGGEINPDDKNVKDYFSHGSGNVGGVLVGKRHSEGGIKAVNKSTNQPLEMEGGEVVITRNAVSDNQKREFEGKMMTNREILSKINESGGGVSFADGGDIPESIYTSGKEYKYGGKMMKDHEIVSSCGCKHSMAEGGMIKPEKPIEKMTKLEVMNFIHKIEPTKFFYPRDTISARKIAERKYQEYLSKKNMAEGGITGDLHSLTDKLLAQKIEIFIKKVMPIKFYYIDEDSNSLIIGLDENYTTGMAEKLHKEATSSAEFFDADSVNMEYNQNTGHAQYSIKLKKVAKFGKGGKMAEGGRLNIGTIKKTDSDVIFDKQSGAFYLNVIDGAGNRTNKLNVNTIDDIFEKYPSFKLNKLGEKEFEDYMAEGGETDYQTELKNHLFPKIEVDVEVEVEPIMEEMPINEHYITADDLGLSDGMPMLAVGTIVYSSGGNDRWEVVSFSDDGVNLVNKPKSPLQSKMEDKHLTFDEIIKYFKDKAISIKNISTDRELEPAIALVKNKLPQKSYAMGGFIDGDEDEDARIMQSQFGKSNFK
jgi:bacterioferritin (cytochrome b1)